MRWLTILLGIVVLLLGILPLIDLAGYLPLFLGFVPLEGIFYNIIIALAGAGITYISIKKGKL